MNLRDMTGKMGKPSWVSQSEWIANMQGIIHTVAPCSCALFRCTQCSHEWLCVEVGELKIPGDVCSQCSGDSTLASMVTHSCMPLNCPWVWDEEKV